MRIGKFRELTTFMLLRGWLETVFGALEVRRKSLFVVWTIASNFYTRSKHRACPVFVFLAF